MVCLGNLCRSPLAQGILASKIDPSVAHIDSAGTASYHVGKLPDRRSIAVAKQHNIDLTNQRARAFSKEDFSEFDLIYVMDRSNYNALVDKAEDAQSMGKVRMILDELFPGQHREVPDPYYGGFEGFEEVYQLLEASCRSIAKKITKD